KAMNSVVTVTALSMVLGVPLREVKPRSPAPVQRRAFLDSAGWVTVQHPRTKPVTVPVGDKARLPPGVKTVQRYVTYIPSTHYPPGDVKVYDTKGNKVDPKDLPKLLKNPVPVLVSTDGNKVHPYYLRNVKEGTLVLVLPKPQP